MIELLAAAGLLFGSGAGAHAPAGSIASTAAGASSAALQEARDPPGDTIRDSAVPDSLTGTIEGRVLGQESGEPLSFVVVEIGEGETYRATRTGEDGRYVIRKVRPGRRHLRARALDRQPLELTIKVPARETVQLDLSLGLRPVGLPLLRVMGLDSWTDVDLRDSRELTPGSPAAAELRALEASPGVAELGLAEQVRPGGPGPNPADPGSTLYVRGAATDLKMVLLDGAPVYAPFHLGGLMDALQPGIIDSSRVYVGGAPARYNGGLSYIMDLGTRPGRREETSARGAVDLLGARTQVEGPAGPGSYYVGVRGLHGLGSRGLTEEPLPYGYRDALTRVDMPLSDADRIAVTGFLNRESVDLDPEVGFDGSVHWGNRAGSMRYRHRSENGEIQFMAAGGRFRTRLPVNGAPNRAAEGRSARARLALDATRDLDDLRVQFGASYDHYAVSYRRSRSGEEDSFLAGRRSTGDMMGAYADLVFPATDELSFRAGLRSDLFLPEKGRVSPRLTAALELGPTSVLSVTAGRYHQYVRSPETVLGSGLTSFTPSTQESAAQAGGPVNTQLQVASASHLVVGLDHAPRDGLRVGVEGFYKGFQNVPQAETMRSSGLDLWVDYRGDEWSAWGGYALAFVWSRNGEVQYGEDFAGRHLFSGGMSAPLPSDVRLDVEVATSAGLPFTPLPTPVETASSSRGPGDRPATTRLSASASDRLAAGAPEGSYLRLDVKLSRSWPIHLLDSNFQLTPYVQVLNALDRRDALFYQFDPADDLKPNSLSAVPLLPVAGIEWEI